MSLEEGSDPLRIPPELTGLEVVGAPIVVDREWIPPEVAASPAKVNQGEISLPAPTWTTRRGMDRDFGNRLFHSS